MYAASEGHEAAMKVLLQAGADPTVQDQVSEGGREGVLLLLC
jgi:ankyrin repeat protein